MSFYDLFRLCCSCALDIWYFGRWNCKTL